MGYSFSIPPIGPKQSKVWGATRLLFAHHGVECHVIDVRKGGYCSRHRHEHKWNRFVILEGSLLVRIFQGETVDETTIGSGQVTDVPPGVWHQFECLEDGRALELYWVLLNEADIERMSVGGKK